MCNTKKHILRRGLAMLNPYNTGIFTINIIIFQSRKLAILVTAYHDEFVQCVSPIKVKRVFEKSNLLLALATVSRGYTDKTQRPGLKTLILC